jgi:anaerobic ribonucleoside-triphosphate reductase activating protein
MVAPRTTVEGPGLRAAVWVQGCAIRCPGCVNPHLWNAVGGRECTVEEVMAEIRPDAALEGITLLGGEPFDQALRVAGLAAAAARRGLSVMTFTGYRYEELRERADAAALLAATDLLVDGPYLRDQPDHHRPWAGSTNQRFLALTPRYRRLVDELPDPVVPLEVHVSTDGRVQVVGTPIPELLGGLRGWLGTPRPARHTPTWTNGAQ